MNVYDFDQTIYYPDSSYHFFLFCLRRFPRAVLPVIPRAIRLVLRYRRGIVPAKILKEQLFSFLSKLRDPEQIVEEFWRSHRRFLQDWYLRQKKEDDLIISASPDFLLRPLANELGFALIATQMDLRSGRIQGENCHGTEKVRRFRDEFPDGLVDSFYSDSLSDAPMAALAEKAFLVNKNRLQPWPEKHI